LVWELTDSSPTERRNFLAGKVNIIMIQSDRRCKGGSSMTEAKRKTTTSTKMESRGFTQSTNQLVELIRMRRSIRHMTGERIPDEDLELILDAARYAPSPENMQMWRYVLIRDDVEMKRIIADISQEAARYVFGNFPYEGTQGRLWYMPDASRPGTYEEMRDGSLFRYPEKADAVIICCASETWHDSTAMYPNELCGSVVVAMGVMNMWLVAHSMGYACAYQAVPFADKRHVEFICDKLGSHEPGHQSQPFVSAFQKNHVCWDLLDGH